MRRKAVAAREDGTRAIAAVLEVMVLVEQANPCLIAEREWNHRSTGLAAIVHIQGAKV